MDELGFELFCSQFRKLDMIKTSSKIEIYNAFDEETQTVRILKICKKKDLSSVCQALMDIRHPNVAVVYDFVYYNGDTYILEEKLQGETLQDKLSAEGKMSLKDVSKIVTKVCDGLSILHAKNPPIIHNDIKPSNIFICDDGNVKVFDFDISRVYKENANQNTEIVATEPYASPAHYGYGQTDQRSDVYSLGVVIHKMLTGQVLNEKKESIYKGPLKKVINKCIQYDPKNTYKSVIKLKKDIEKHVSHKMGKLVAALFGVLVCGALIFGAGAVIKDATNDNETQPIVKETDENEFFTDNNTASITEKSDKTTQTAENNSKAIKVVSKVDGGIVSMVTLNDGTIVYLEALMNECHIKTSTGIDNVINIPSEVYDMPSTYYDLIYNIYTNELYLVFHAGDAMTTEIYPIDKKYNVGETPRYIGEEGNGEFCGFFLSDGTLYYDRFVNNLIDSNQWVEIGSASFSATTQIKDRMFYINYYTVTEEKGYGAESVSHNVPWDYLIGGKYCTTHNGIYFIAKSNYKDYIYKFDGDTFTQIVCLNDYKYYTYSSYEKVAVTKDKIWLYDSSANTIKELPIE